MDGRPQIGEHVTIVGHPDHSLPPILQTKGRRFQGTVTALLDDGLCRVAIADMGEVQVHVAQLAVA